MVLHKTRLLLSIVGIWSFLATSIAQENFAVNTIPDSLKQNAYAVTRDYRVTCNVNSIKQAECKIFTANTILDEKGNEAANFVCTTDQFVSLVSFSGKIYDGTGKLISKIKKSDLKISEYSRDLATDNRNYYFLCPKMHYPITVVYECSIKFTNGYLDYTSFSPVFSFNKSIEHASYVLEIPANTQLNSKIILMKDSIPETSEIKGRVIKKWNLSSFKALNQEDFCPKLKDLTPHIYTAPTSFVYGGYSGSQNNWKELGDWQYRLLEKRDTLSANTRHKIIEMTNGLSSDKEKVKRLYDYLNESTRYVSIQLGIGGFQPMPATEVDQVGFGDCKALSNYMKAMLNVIGIPSKYTVISTENTKLFADYPNELQTNHVILQVLPPNDTIWLECTNPELPFGYIHSKIAGHEALSIDENGGKLIQLPSYPDSLNIESYVVEVSLSNSQNSIAKIKKTSYLTQYEDNWSLVKMDSKDRIDYLQKSILLSNPAISNVNVQENKVDHPSIKTSYTLNALYGNTTGNRMFVPLNPFRKSPVKLSSKKRILPLVMEYGYVDCDTIKLKIPEGYAIESIPQNAKIDCVFGQFSSSLIPTENDITIIQRLHFYKGRYASDKIDELKNFFEKIQAGYDGKIVLKKK